MTEFIFMLTRHDVTIPNAMEVFEEIKDTGMKFIGCKDIGLPLQELQELFKKMKRANMTTFLEVVSNDEDEHFAGVKKAMSVETDYLIGGMPRFTDKTLKYLKERKASLRFFPYIGKVVGHPCKLEGSVEQIINNGIEFEKMGVHGINLLLYRYIRDTDLLLKRITETLEIPLIVAGNIDNFEKIEQLKSKNVWAFTIGTAILEKRIVPGRNLREQIATVLNRL